MQTRSVQGDVGGGGTITTTTSTTHHTTHSAAADCVAHAETTVTQTTSLGPGTILIGEDQSATFFVAAGTTNINTNTHTEFFICDATPIPTLSEWAQIGMAALLLGGGLLALRRGSGQALRRRKQRSGVG
jgi:IPTL-CTERM motif